MAGCNVLTGSDVIEVGGASPGTGGAGAANGGNGPGGSGAQAGGTVGSPCDGVSCGPNGDCAVVGDDAACDCDPGYHAAGLTCEADAPPGPCDGVVCGANAGCVGGICSCDNGFEGDPAAGCTAVNPDEAVARAELVQIALGEVGYCEGVDNRPYMLNQPGYWCYDFVDWVYQQSSYSLPAPLSLPQIFAADMPAWWKPEAGDMIKFTIQHYGMVEKSSPDASAIQTIEGNYNDCVVNNQVSLQEISYFGYLDSQLQ